MSVHVVLKGKLHLTRPVRYDHEMKRLYWSEADVAHLAERIRWPEVAEYRPATAFADAGEEKAASQ